jgi:hypothetical protein
MELLTYGYCIYLQQPTLTPCIPRSGKSISPPSTLLMKRSLMRRVTVPVTVSYNPPFLDCTVIARTQTSLHMRFQNLSPFGVYQARKITARIVGRLPSGSQSAWHNSAHPPKLCVLSRPIVSRHITNSVSNSFMQTMRLYITRSSSHASRVHKRPPENHASSFTGEMNRLLPAIIIERLYNIRTGTMM